MAANSKIEWCHHTFNPWIGCTRVSAACDHCYAEAMAKRRKWALWGNHPRHRTSASYWKQPAKWNLAAIAAGERHRVFCASLADVFDNQVPDQWRWDLFDLIDATPGLDWLLLTKRPQLADVVHQWWRIGADNVWLGISAENEREYRRRWDAISRIMAPVYFVSCEPMLQRYEITANDNGKRPDWFITGGESGPGYRETRDDDFRFMRDQCTALKIAYFHKQSTAKRPIPEDLRVRQFPKVAA